MSRKRSHRPSEARRSSRAHLNNLWILLGLLAGAALLISLAVLLTGRPLQGVAAEISVEDTYQKYADGVFLLDVRTQEEWDEVHIPDTTLIPLEELPQRLEELPQDHEIVVVCRSGNRSQQGRDILLDAGFAQVSSMAGGLREWQSKGYPVEAGQ